MPRRSRLLRRLPDLGRALLLLGSLGVVATWIIWVERPQWVDGWDRAVIDSYVSPYTSALAAASAELVAETPEGRQSAIARLDGLLQDLAGIQKNDRLEGVKRRALELLVSALLAEQRLAEVLPRVQEWQDFDPLDFRAPIQLALAQARMPDGDVLQRETLGRLFDRLPAAQSVFDAYLDCLRSQGDMRRSAAAVARHIALGVRPAWEPDPLDSKWEVFWDLGGGFGAERRAPATVVSLMRTRLRLKVSLPAGTVQMRLDLPEGPPLVWAHPRMATQAGGWTPIGSLATAMHDVQQTMPGVFESTGRDPSVTWTLPAPLAGDTNLVIEGHIVPGMPQHVRTVLLSDETAALIPEVRPGDRDPAGERLRRYRAMAFLGTSVALHRGRAPGAAARIAVAPTEDPTASFVIQWTLSGDAADALVELPGATGMVLTLEAATEQADGSTQTVTLEAGRELVATGTGWRITGPSPTLLLSGIGPDSERLRIRGVAR